jgi:hypothetical protein
MKTAVMSFRFSSATEDPFKGLFEKYICRNLITRKHEEENQVHG